MLERVIQLSSSPPAPFLPTPCHCQQGLSVSPPSHLTSRGSKGEGFSDPHQPVVPAWSAQLAKQRTQFHSRLPRVKFA